MSQAVVSLQERQEAELYIKKQEVLRAERSNWESNWQETLDYTVPRKGDVISMRTPGDKRGYELFDTTAITSNDLLSAALHGMLTNPTVLFFEMILGDPSVQPDEETKQWLQEVAQIIFAALNDSNFQTEIHEIYIDLGSIGTACLWIGEHDKNYVHFAARPMKEIFIDENNLGLIDTVHREFQWKPRQIIQEFGEKNLNPWIVKKYKEGCEENFTIIHAVCPEAEGEKGSYSSPHKFKSIYTLKDEPMILHRKGFHEFPFAVPRWTKTSGEKYGRGPGMNMLPDTKLANKMMEVTLKGAQLTIAPPYMVTDDGVVGKVRLTPHGLTVVRDMREAPIRPLVTDARIDFGYQSVEDVRKRIRQGFFLPQVQLGDQGPQKTAYETSAIVEEQLRFMGPVLGRQHSELLKPTINRTYRILERAKKIPQPPRQVLEKGFDVKYSSLVARAQRMSEGQNLTRAISVAAPIINAKPETLDNLNGDAAIKHIFDIYGVPQKLIHKEREVKEAREARAKAQAEMAKQQQEAHQAELASKTLPGAAQMIQAEAQQ